MLAIDRDEKCEMLLGNNCVIDILPKLSNVIPSLSSEFTHWAFSVWFQYLDANSSKYLSFCKSRIL